MATPSRPGTSRAAPTPPPALPREASPPQSQPQSITHNRLLGAGSGSQGHRSSLGRNRQAAGRPGSTSLWVIGPAPGLRADPPSLTPFSPAAPPGSPRRPRLAEPLCPCPVAGQRGRRARARRSRWVGLWPTTSARRPSGSPATTCRSAEPSSQDSRPARSGSRARMSSTSACLPAALAASRQRFSTEDRSPVAAVIGVSSWPAACRKIPGIWVARAALVDTNAA